MLQSLGRLLLDRGQPQQARQLCEQALGVFRAMGDRCCEGLALHVLGCMARLAAGDLMAAAHHSEQAEGLLAAVGNKPSLGELLCERGHIELAAGRGGGSFLERVQAMGDVTDSGPESQLGKAISILQRACRAFEAGEHGRLFRGQLVEDIPEALRRHLHETGQLPEPMRLE